jgi:hypothetical protein
MAARSRVCFDRWQMVRYQWRWPGVMASEFGLEQVATRMWGSARQLLADAYNELHKISMQTL